MYLNRIIWNTGFHNLFLFHFTREEFISCQFIQQSLAERAVGIAFILAQMSFFDHPAAFGHPVAAEVGVVTFQAQPGGPQMVESKSQGSAKSLTVISASSSLLMLIAAFPYS